MIKIKLKKLRKVVPEGSWLNCTTSPRGAPKLGERIKLRTADEHEIELSVTEFLSSQFIAKSDAGRERVLHPADDWVLV